jgi:hypothetical protein
MRNGLQSKDMVLFLDPFSLLQISSQGNANAHAQTVTRQIADSKKAGLKNSMQSNVIASLNLPLPGLYGGTDKEQGLNSGIKHVLPGLPTWETWNGNPRISQCLVPSGTPACHPKPRLSHQKCCMLLRAFLASCLHGS